MEIVKTRAFARAGFLGNPFDGYFGKTISCFGSAAYCFHREDYPDITCLIKRCKCD